MLIFKGAKLQGFGTYLVNWLRTLSATCHIVQQPIAIREGEKHRALKQTEMLNVSGVIDCKRVGFTFKSLFQGANIRASTREECEARGKNVYSKSHSPFSASLHVFCLTVSAHLTTQKYRRFCGLAVRYQNKLPSTRFFSSLLI